jgi:hypothetical protein
MKHAWILTLCLPAALGAATVTFTVDPAQDRLAISPLTYGANNNDTLIAPFRRQGGNRMTGYNWENNASNAGSDWKHNSDFWLLHEILKPLPTDGNQAPGAVVKNQAESIRALGAEPLVTLPMAGFVAADGKGPVEANEKAPSRRWRPVAFKKPGPFKYPPDRNAPAVYVDEFVAYLVKSFQGTPGGKLRYYSLDNEPDIWSDGKGGATHPRLHPAHATYAELAQKSAALADAVLDVDPQAQIFAPVNYGWNGLKNLQDAPDAAQYAPRYGMFMDYFLDQMRQASLKAGRRLLHYYDLHYYTEAEGPGGRLNKTPTATSREDWEARMQAPRSLWDPSYIENSWITKWSLPEGDKPIRLIPRVKAAIARWYPGTKLSITEWDFGGADHISGGLAAADALGIFGREGVAACSWPAKEHAYLDAAYKLYLDFDGKGSKFGDISIRGGSSDVAQAPFYASQDSKNPRRLTLMAINRAWDQTLEADFRLSLPQGRSIASIRAFRLGQDKPVLEEAGVPVFQGGGFKDTLPKFSASLYEIIIR